MCIRDSYYDISIGKAINTPGPDVILALCAGGDAENCARITRDPVSGTIQQMRATAQNISKLRTSGFDMEAAYRMPLSNLFSSASGTLAFRALATRITKLRLVTFTNVTNPLGNVGDTVLNAMPKWRGSFSTTYSNDLYSLDARLRYAGGGKFDKSRNIINHDIKARVYVDMGAEFKPDAQFSFFLRVNNLFDRDPPLVTVTYNPFFDMIGRQFTAGARVKF